MSFEKIEKLDSAGFDNSEKKLSYEPGVGIKFSKIEKPSERPEYDELKDYLEQVDKELSGPIIEEAKRKRSQLLESRGLFSLSKEDFDTYFASRELEIGADLKQGNTGDCYIVAAVHAISRSPHFEMVVRSSMKRLPGGVWEVKIPLLSEGGEVVTIFPEEILPQKNRKFFKRKRGEVIPDLRKKLTPLKGKEGMRALEAAFIKQKFGFVDRLRAEGGWSDEVLLSLGGENFKKFSIVGVEKYNKENKKLETLGLDSLDEKDMAYLDYYLENFDPEIHIATVSTKHYVSGVLGYRAMGSDKFLVPGHAYSLVNVDKERRVINLANPWDTSKSFKLTFGQFKQVFHALRAIRINSAKLLKNLGKIGENN